MIGTIIAAMPRIFTNSRWIVTSVEVPAGLRVNVFA
jgi:hypothetical protein